jgi:hypothetical protein
MGESVTISALVSNTGDLPGSYEVNLLIDGTVAQTEEITLNGGDSERVSFQVPADIDGEYTATIDGLSGSYVVRAPSVIEEEETSEKLEISSLDVSPLYDPDTGKLVSARIVWELNKAYDVILEEQLRLDVFLDGALLEVIPLESGQIQPDGNAAEVSYVPSAGWQTGTYSFQAEYGTEDEGLILSPQTEYLSVTPEQIARTASWSTLLLVLGCAGAVAVVTVVIVLIRRRDML